MPTHTKVQNERSRKIKEALAKRFGKGGVSVRKGKGTAHEWVYVTIILSSKDKPKQWGAQLARERKLVVDAEKIVSELNGISLAQYLSDTGPGSDWSPCLLVNVEWE